MPNSARYPRAPTRAFSQPLQPWYWAMSDVDDEIEIYRHDEEPAQQAFFAYLGVRDLIAQRPDVHAAVNRNAMFWLTTHRAMFVSTFVGLGRRIFDQSAHESRSAARHGRPQSAGARQRRPAPAQGAVISAEQAAEYVEGKHESTAPDLRTLREEVDRWRRVYARSTARSGITSRTTRVRPEGSRCVAGADEHRGGSECSSSCTRCTKGCASFT